MSAKYSLPPDDDKAADGAKYDEDDNDDDDTDEEEDVSPQSNAKLPIYMHIHTYTQRKS